MNIPIIIYLQKYNAIIMIMTVMMTSALIQFNSIFIYMLA
jgi:hypothetical protein